MRPTARIAPSRHIVALPVRPPPVCPQARGRGHERHGGAKAEGSRARPRRTARRWRAGKVAPWPKVAPRPRGRGRDAAVAIEPRGAQFRALHQERHESLVAGRARRWSDVGQGREHDGRARGPPIAVEDARFDAARFVGHPYGGRPRFVRREGDAPRGLRVRRRDRRGARSCRSFGRERHTPPVEPADEPVVAQRDDRRRTRLAAAEYGAGCGRLRAVAAIVAACDRRGERRRGDRGERARAAPDRNGLRRALAGAQRGDRAERRPDPRRRPEHGAKSSTQPVVLARLNACQP